MEGPRKVSIGSDTQQLKDSDIFKGRAARSRRDLHQGRAARSRSTSGVSLENQNPLTKPNYYAGDDPSTPAPLPTPPVDDLAYITTLEEAKDEIRSLRRELASCRDRLRDSTNAQYAPPANALCSPPQPVPSPPNPAPSPPKSPPKRRRQSAANGLELFAEITQLDALDTTSSSARTMSTPSSEAPPVMAVDTSARTAGAYASPPVASRPQRPGSPDEPPSPTSSASSSASSAQAAPSELGARRGQSPHGHGALKPSQKLRAASRSRARSKGQVPPQSPPPPPQYESEDQGEEAEGAGVAGDGEEELVQQHLAGPDRRLIPSLAANQKLQPGAGKGGRGRSPVPPSQSSPTPAGSSPAGSVSSSRGRSRSPVGAHGGGARKSPQQGAAVPGSGPGPGSGSAAAEWDASGGRQMVDKRSSRRQNAPHFVAAIGKWRAQHCPQAQAPGEAAQDKARAAGDGGGGRGGNEDDDDDDDEDYDYDNSAGGNGEGGSGATGGTGAGGAGAAGGHAPVRVFIRKRPLFADEEQEGEFDCLTMDPTGCRCVHSSAPTRAALLEGLQELQ